MMVVYISPSFLDFLALTFVPYFLDFRTFLKMTHLNVEFELLISDFFVRGDASGFANFKVFMAFQDYTAHL